jgi:hypothetical protein
MEYFRRTGRDLGISMLEKLSPEATMHARNLLQIFTAQLPCLLENPFTTIWKNPLFHMLLYQKKRHLTISHVAEAESARNATITNSQVES